MMAAVAGPAPARADDPFRVDVLGDSIASGFGVGDGIADELRCSRMLPTDRCDHVDRAYGRAFADGLRAADTGGRRVAYRHLAPGGGPTWGPWAPGPDPPR